MAEISKITEIAYECAWPITTPNKKYKASYYRGYKDGRYNKYGYYLNVAWGDINARASRKDWSKQHALGAACSVFVGTCLRASGAMPNYERRYPYSKIFRGKKNWVYIGKSNHHTLKDGDVLASGSSHICLCTRRNGKRYIAEAGFHSKHYPWITRFYGNWDVYRYTGGDLEGKEVPTNTSSTTTTTTVTTTTTTTVDSTKYIEHYYIKPKDYVNAKDIINTESEIDQINPSQRREILKEDQNDLLFFNSSYKIFDLKKYSDVSVQTLISQYTRILKALQSLIIYNGNFVEGQEYLSFSKKEKFCEYREYKKNSKNIIFFLLKKDEQTETWIEFYNDIYLKLITLKAFKEASEKFVSIFNTNEYSNLLSDYIFLNDEIITEKFLKKQSYIRTVQSTNFVQDLNDINKNIQRIKTSINILQQRQNKTFPKIQQLNKKINEYQKLYDNLYDNKENIKNNFSDLYVHWNKNIILSPKSLNFWLEFLDNNSDIIKYNVKNIGLRPITQENNAIRSVYFKNVPNIIYYENILKQKKTGYNYFKISNLNDFFENSTQGLSAKDVINDLLYQHSYGAEEISLNTIPIYYLEPSTRIFIQDKQSHINDEYILNKISYDLGNSFNSTLSANKANERLY